MVVPLAAVSTVYSTCRIPDSSQRHSRPKPFKDNVNNDNILSDLSSIGLNTQIILSKHRPPSTRVNRPRLSGKGLGSREDIKKDLLVTSLKSAAT